MGEKNIFRTIDQAREEVIFKSKKRLKISVEIDKLLEQLEQAADVDSREEISGEVRRLLEEGRRILEREDGSGSEEVRDYYRRLDDLEKSAA